MAIQLFEHNFVVSKLQFHREVLSHGVLELNVSKKAGTTVFPSCNRDMTMPTQVCSNDSAQIKSDLKCIDSHELLLDLFRVNLNSFKWI